MKIRIEIETGLQEEEVVIRCRQVDEKILKLQAAVRELDTEGVRIALYQGDTEYFVPLEEVLFFETEGRGVRAHTADAMFETPYRLFELEELLPGSFMRISKSTVVNLRHIYSITRNLTASSMVEFWKSPKKVYVSRNYYKILVERLGEKRMRR